MLFPKATFVDFYLKLGVPNGRFAVANLLFKLFKQSLIFFVFCVVVFDSCHTYEVK